MRVYIANFGRGNWAWPDCLKRGTLVVMDDERVHPFWVQGDREEYIRRTQAIIQQSSGVLISKPVASRWFNLNTVLKETVGDIWIHREKAEIWWTESIESAPEIEIIDDPQLHMVLPKFICITRSVRVGRIKIKKGKSFDGMPDMLVPKSSFLQRAHFNNFRKIMPPTQNL
jgi:hypothetical protein